MAQKIAVAVVHGIGNQAPEFADKLEEALQRICQGTCGEDVVIKPVYWAPAMQKKEDALWERLTAGGPMAFKEIRRVAIDYVADAMAYQPTADDRKTYDDIHVIYAQTLKALAAEAGEKAPLCIVAHSLGTVITSNYIYDLQKPTLISPEVKAVMGDKPTALERGETLNLLYTLGSPIALWSLRYRDFGKPIAIPAPELINHYPDLQCAWMNYYDKDDLIGFPLRDLNEGYSRAVSADKQVNVGGMMENWNPLSHLGYLNDNDVVRPIAESLINTWKTVNSG